MQKMYSDLNFMGEQSYQFRRGVRFTVYLACHLNARCLENVVRDYYPLF